MSDLIQYAELIVGEFEKNMIIPTSVNDWEDDLEGILLYLPAKKYIESSR